MLKSALRVCGSVGALLLLAPPAARPDAVYLKDGTVLYGKVVSQKETIEDPYGGPSIPVPKAGGFFAVSDGARMVIVPTKNLDPNRPPDATNIGADQIFSARPTPR